MGNYRLIVGTYPGCLPYEGDRAFPLTIDFSVDTSWIIDFLGLQEQNKISQVTTIYVDAVDSGQATIFYFPVSQQRIVVPAGAQVYLPVLCTNPPQLIVQGTSGDKPKLEFLNFFVPMQIVNAASPSTGNDIITEDSNPIITEAGDNIISET